MFRAKSSLWVVLPIFLLSCGGGNNNAECGDGVVEAGETCDDGNTQNGDGCDANCQIEVPENCGNGVVDAGEECDDGNNTDGDGCSAACQNEIVLDCGNGVIQAELGEECDDNNAIDEDGCSANCLVEFCGDGVLQGGLGEECDDGNLLPGDACLPICENGPVPDNFLFNEFDPRNDFQFGRYCDQMMTRHATVRAVDVTDSNLRWQCGDVTGITNPDHGQEYCEFSAIVNGVEVTTTNGIEDGEQLTCLFTTVFNNNTGLDADLETALALPENLGVSVQPLDSNTSLVRMDRGINSKGAADTLISQCSSTFGDNNEVRQAACAQAFNAAEKAGNFALAQELENICDVGQQDLSVAAFAEAEALGAQIFEEGQLGFEDQRTVRACIVTARGFGAHFRNSDTNICGRSFRAGLECDCSFDQLPSDLPGFLIAEWLTPENDRLPPECRFAQVDGRDFPHLMICDVPDQELAAVREDARYSDDLTGFCNDRFGKNIGVLAPLSQIRGNQCTSDTQFCEEFTAN